MTTLSIASLTIYYTLLILLSICALHRLHLVRLRRRHARLIAPLITTTPNWPRLAVQLPVYNEPNVVARLVEAAGALIYPGQLEIQLLDDSTDETSSIGAECIAILRSRGVNAVQLRRHSRDGYKAGALAFGMQQSDAELFAVFDADFVPTPDLLIRIVPFFADPSVGMVQARWDHLNREASTLTRAQAVFLDGHFAIESAARFLGGRFFNFNGTAGVWRRQAIEDAGGWSSETLTEDLDLSYRAQLAGWRFVFLADVVVPSEIPATLGGFHEQQHRWAKGSIQTARKLLGSVLRAPLPLSVRIEALFHLTNNFAYLLTLVLAMLFVPATLARLSVGAGWLVLFDLAVFATSTGAILTFYLEGQRAAGRPRPSLGTLIALLPLGIGLSVRNSAAVLSGLIGRGGHFRRTPKAGSAIVTRTLMERTPRIPLFESMLLVFFVVSVLSFAANDTWSPIPILLLFAFGYGHAAVLGIRERLAYGRERTEM